ncbi:phytanoyl-CoA dioxygenase family protein [Algisphaera agarilytica]|uniref:Phytanoyl-CoA hydroxylase n=1 Tax=Algisphaera agarilytica TaxID=1385975 RepID=A0A7X0H6P8_9BACT|nr:phytanoyl-CoA dioxygenase family protein [Algisphaera agarilytica]MBB6430138.1 phytanoyl-CoA hydroxylase [Algisphaera agarilytica]
MTANPYETPQIDVHAPQDYPEGLYAATRTAELLPDLSAVDEAALRRFHETGYLAFEKAFDAQTIADAVAAIDDLTRGRNPEFNGIAFESAAGGVDLNELDELARAELVRKLMAFARFDARLDAVMRAPALMDLLRTLIGDEPTCFQEMALLKPPGGGREKPWHQDHAYFDYPAGTRIAGVWIALDEARLDNGCMHLVESTHKEIVPHFNRRDWQICDSHVMGRPTVAVPLPPGGALVFSGLLMHGTPTNFSEHRRWALQFHYTGQSTQKCDTETRLALFGSEGRDVEC